MARPKVYTKETQPYSLTIRIPRELYNQMVRYTGSKERSRSNAMLEGLNLWLERQEASGALEHDSNNAVMHELNTPVHFLDDGIPFDDERWPMLTPENAAAEGKLSDNNMPTGTGAVTRQGRKGQTTLSANVTDTVTDTHGCPVPEGAMDHQGEHVTDTVTDTSDQIEAERVAIRALRSVTDTVTDTDGVTDTVTVTGHAPESFDTTKYRLGKLCPQGHDYQGTGQSLRVNNKAGYCIPCNVEQQRESRARRSQQKRQTQPVQG